MDNTLKSLGKDRVGGYLVVFGNESAKDLHGEFFTPATDFCLEWFNRRPMLYHHGLDGKTETMIVGVIDTIKKDHTGLWAEARLDIDDELNAWEHDQRKRRRAYLEKIRAMLGRGELSWSSGSVGHLTRRKASGEIVRWPLIEGSATPGPAEPRRTEISLLKTALSGVKSIIDLKSLEAIENRNDDSETGEPDTPPGGKQDTPPAVEQPESVKSGELKMLEQYAQIVRMVAQALEVELSDDQIAELANQIDANMQTRTGKESDEIDDDMVKAAFADAKFKSAIVDSIKALAPEPEPTPSTLDPQALAQEAVKAASSSNGAGGQSQLPAHTGGAASGHIKGMKNKYERAGLTAPDLHYLAIMMSAGNPAWRPSVEMAKTMAYKAESEMAAGQYSLDPDAYMAVQAIKDDEIVNTGQVGFGDEWVPDLWLGELWERDRQPNIVFPALSPVEMPSNPYNMPLEGVDPVVYAVPETTDEAQIAFDSSNPIPISKPGTAKLVMNAKKLALRIGVSEEQNEDSIIPVLQSSRRQALRVMADAMDNVILNADSEAAGNINLDGGTPGATDKYNYGGGDGLIKRTLVTWNAGDATGVDFGGAPTLALMRSIRFKMPIYYAQQPDNLAYIVDGQTYAALLNLEQFLTVDKAGDRATIIRGTLGFIDNIPVLVSAEMGLAAANGKISSTPASNTKGRAVCAYMPAWRPGFRRRVRVNAEYISATDSHVLTASLRMALVTKGTAAAPSAAVGYNITV